MAASARISPKSVATSSRRHLFVFSNSPARPLRSSYISCLRRIVCLALSRFACTRRRRFASRSSSVSCTLFGPLPRRFPATVGAGRVWKSFPRVSSRASARRRRLSRDDGPPPPPRRSDASPAAPRRPRAEAETRNRRSRDSTVSARVWAWGFSRRVGSRRRREKVATGPRPASFERPSGATRPPRTRRRNLWRTSSRRRSRRASAGLARRGSARASAAAEGASLSANLRASLFRRRGNPSLDPGGGRRRRGLGAGGFSFRAPSDETRAPSAVSSLGVRVAGVRVGSPSREGRKSARRGWDGQRGPRRVRGRGARSEKNKARTVQVGREKMPRRAAAGESGEGRGPRTTRRSSPKRQAKNASAPGRLATIRGRISARGRRRARAQAPRRIGAIHLANRPNCPATWQESAHLEPRVAEARAFAMRARRTREKFGASAREVGSGARGGRSRTRGA